MSEKQDRQQWRTPSQFEQKYNFGKSFAEVMGLAEDARNTAEAALKASGDLDEALDHEEIFNRLTNNGEIEGMYEEDGHIYFNASYIKSGTMLADLIKAGVLQSKDGKSFYLDLDSGILKGTFSELSISGKTVEDITNETMNDFCEATTKDIEDLQSQIDGNITSWFYDYVPTTSNEPASLWTTDELKNQHLGDLFYVVENDTDGGKVYRWVLINGAYKWTLLEDSEVTKALKAAEKAQDTADGKRRVFVTQPTPPYDIGDLWAQGDNGDLMVCKTSRATGNFISYDWVLATEYINSEKANEIAEQVALLELGKYADTVTESLGDLQSQLDGNVTTWFYNYLPTTSNEPASKWSDADKEHHLGDLFYIVDNDNYVGKVYRWTKTSGVYSWELYGDTKVIDALNTAYNAKDTADGKRRVFIVQPTPPYDDGDLWAQGENGDLKVCKTARASGSFVSSDWQLATDYINSELAESIAQDRVDAQTQEFIFNKLTNNGELQGLFMENGKMYINAEYINFDRLNGKDISMNGVFTNTANVFLELGQEEIDHLRELIDFYYQQGKSVPYDYLYDFNDDGEVNTDDLVIGYDVLAGKQSLKNWNNAMKSNVTIYIDLSNPEKAIRIMGTNMWGRSVDSYIGVNFTTVKNPETERRLKALEDKVEEETEVVKTQVINYSFAGVGVSVRFCRKGNVTEMSLIGSTEEGFASAEQSEFEVVLPADFLPDRSPLNSSQQPIYNIPPSCPLLATTEMMDVHTLGVVTFGKFLSNTTLKICYNFYNNTPEEGWSLYASMTWIN